MSPYVSSFADMRAVHESLSPMVFVRSRRNPRCALSSILFSLHDVWSSAMVAVYSRSLYLQVSALVDANAKSITLQYCALQGILHRQLHDLFCGFLPSSASVDVNSLNRRDSHSSSPHPLFRSCRSVAFSAASFSPSSATEMAKRSAASASVTACRAAQIVHV